MRFSVALVAGFGNQRHISEFFRQGISSES